MNVADTTFKAMNSNLLNVFRFTEFEKSLSFLLEVRYNSKITHIKTKGVVICHGNSSGNHVYYCGKRLTQCMVTSRCLKPSSIWVFFHEQSRFTGQQRKAKAISLIPLNHFHRFTDTQTLAWRLPQRAHLYIQLSVGLNQEPLVSRCKLLTTKLYGKEPLVSMKT